MEIREESLSTDEEVSDLTERPDNYGRAQDQETAHIDQPRSLCIGDDFNSLQKDGYEILENYDEEDTSRISRNEITQSPDVDPPIPSASLCHGNSKDGLNNLQEHEFEILETDDKDTEVAQNVSRSVQNQRPADAILSESSLRSVDTGDDFNNSPESLQTKGNYCESSNKSQSQGNLLEDHCPTKISLGSVYENTNEFGSNTHKNELGGDYVFVYNSQNSKQNNSSVQTSISLDGEHVKTAPETTTRSCCNTRFQTSNLDTFSDQDTLPLSPEQGKIKLYREEYNDINANQHGGISLKQFESVEKESSNDMNECQFHSDPSVLSTTLIVKSEDKGLASRLFWYCFQEKHHNLVLETLQKKLQEIYMKELEHVTLTHLIWDVAHTPDNLIHALNLKNASKSLKTGDVPKRILMTGKPGFGKTTYCSVMAYQWAVSDLPISKLKLCLLFRLKDLDNGTTLTDHIIGFLTRIVTEEIEDIEITDNIVRNVVKNISDDVVVLLDGYDEMTENGKNKVEEFLGDPVFERCRVIITTRPHVEPSFINAFEVFFCLKGFSDMYLMNFLKHFNLVQDILENDSLPSETKRMFNLMYEMPPAFVAYVLRLILSRDLSIKVIPDSFTLLDLVFKRISEDMLLKFDDITKSDTEEFYIQLGKLFYSALLHRQFTFTEELLQTALLKGFQFIMSCHVFCEDRNWSDKLWIVSNKLLMVFFATKYLSHRWSKIKDDRQRKRFLKNVFCYGGCSGDYVAGEGDSAALYLVGVLPEIVLNFGRQFSLDQATFQMYHDAERVEYSHAFDSVNLLTRIGERNLEIFGFDERGTHSVGLAPVFQSIVNCVSVDTLCADYAVYCNKYEKKDFLKLALTSGEPDVALFAVFRANDEGKVDRLYLDFAFALFDELFDFVSDVLTQLLPGFNLHQGCKFSKYGESVFSVLSAIVQSDISRPVLIGCGGNIEKGIPAYRKNAMIKVRRCDETKVKYVEVSHQGFSNRFFVNKNLRFKALELWKRRADIVVLTEDCGDYDSQSRITINLL